MAGNIHTYSMTETSHVFKLMHTQSADVCLVCLWSLKVMSLSPEGNFAELFTMRSSQRVVRGLVRARWPLITTHAGVCMKAQWYQVINFSVGPPKLTGFLWRGQRTRPHWRDMPQRPKATATTSAESVRAGPGSRWGWLVQWGRAGRPPRASGSSPGARRGLGGGSGVLSSRAR